MAEYATFYETHGAGNGIDADIGASGAAVANYSNIVYDTVLGGGGWQRWASTSAPDITGTGYNAATGGSTGDWQSGSYSYEVG